jgi:hypothetical protein
MFRPRRPLLARPQKRRLVRLRSSLLTTRKLPFLRWPGVVSFGGGFIAGSVVDRLLVWARRYTLSLHAGRRYWVNIQVARVITRKSAKIRMGKGKGARRGVMAKV